MNTPPLLLGATLLFWGWQTGLLPFAAVMAVLLEGSRIARARWEFSQADLDRIWNLCTLVFMGAAIYAFTAGDGSMTQNSPRVHAEALSRSVRAVFLFFQWMPLYFIPMMAAQAWGQQERLALSTFSWWLRRKRVQRLERESVRRVELLHERSVTSSRSLRREPDHSNPGRDQIRLTPDATRLRETPTLNVSYAYFAICLLGASAARARSPWFLAGLVLLLGWAFWEKRSRGFTPLAWAASLLGAAGLGLITQQGMFYMEAALQRLDNALVARFSQGRPFEVSETRTMLGAVGTLKLSGRIVLRVNAGDQAPPALLRESSYNLFKSPVWGSSKHEFRPLISETEEATWLLVTNGTANRLVTIQGLLPGGKGVLALPQGAARLERLPVFLLEKNRLGAVRSEAGPGFVEFSAYYGAGASIDAPPGSDDLQVPAAERSALAQVAAELKLAGKSDEEIVSALAAFFNGKFEYSTWLGDESTRGANRTPISQFLLQNRKGHCEYFATATTLLLRQARVPARYVIGYAVEEHKGREYIVRARDAHAWCLAWVNGAWREVDNTPGVWQAVEAGRASFWEPVSDAWSQLWFAFSKWRWGQSQLRKYLAWAIAVPLLALAVRLFATKGWRRSAKRPTAASSPLFQSGLDSEFYLIETRLAELGLGCQPDETPWAWLRRITLGGVVSTVGLDRVLALHYRLRFDPQGLGAADRASLSQRAQEWLNAFERQALARRFDQRAEVGGKGDAQ